MGKTAEDMQRAVDIYQSELARLQQMAKETKEEEAAAKKDLEVSKIKTNPAAELGSKFGLFNPAGFMANFPPPPPPPPHPAIPAEVDPVVNKRSNQSGSNNASPLQGMASITNSLTSQPIVPPYRPSQRSYKAVLPPITQEQFDRFESLNTEELVRKVRQWKVLTFGAGSQGDF